MIHASRLHRSVAALAVAALSMPLATLRAQDTTSPAAATARPADVRSPDAILAALYDVISGEKGKARDWARFRSLFAPGARLIPTSPRPDGGTNVRVLSADDYASTIGPRLEQSGFFEREIARTTESYGNVMHAFSTYESRRLASDPAPFARGINSIQLLKDGERWWVVTIFWDSERPGNPIPEKYLHSR